MGQEGSVTTSIGSFINNERDWELKAQESLINRGAHVSRFCLTVALASASLVVALPELLATAEGAWQFWTLGLSVLMLVAAGVSGLLVGRVVRFPRVRAEWLLWQINHGDGTVPLDPDVRYLSSLRETNTGNARYLQWAMRWMWIGTVLAVVSLLTLAYQTALGPPLVADPVTQGPTILAVRASWAV